MLIQLIATADNPGRQLNEKLATAVQDALKENGFTAQTYVDVRIVTKSASAP